MRLRFEGKSIRLGDEVIDPEREWKPTWRKVKTCLQKAIESRRTENYKKKEQQSQFYQEQENKCHLWLSQNYYYYYCYYSYSYYYHSSRHREQQPQKVLLSNLMNSVDFVHHLKPTVTHNIFETNSNFHEK